MRQVPLRPPISISAPPRRPPVQTGSGKTHSVMGILGGDDHQVGLLPRAVRQVFDKIVNDESGAEFAVSCSYLEIYKEVVRDLLEPTTKPGGLAIREDTRNKARGVFVEDLTEVFVMGEADVLECLSCGNANRVVRASRAHPPRQRTGAP